MTTAEQFTYNDLLRSAGDSTPKSIMFKMHFASTHDERLECVRAAIDYIAKEFTKNAHERCKMGEDALSIDIVLALKSMGFQAAHDTQYGGHCDIVVEARDEFLWIAEAKLHDGYEWLCSGFQQLDTRYTTGLPGQDNGELLIYVNQPRLAQVMERWTDALKEKRPDVTIQTCTTNPLYWISTHIHERSGLPFTVRHVPISIYFNPKDK